MRTYDIVYIRVTPTVDRTPPINWLVGVAFSCCPCVPCGGYSILQVIFPNPFLFIYIPGLFFLPFLHIFAPPHLVFGRPKKKGWARRFCQQAKEQRSKPLAAASPFSWPNARPWRWGPCARRAAGSWPTALTACRRNGWPAVTNNGSLGDEIGTDFKRCPVFNSWEVFTFLLKGTRCQQKSVEHPRCLLNGTRKNSSRALRLLCKSCYALLKHLGLTKKFGLVKGAKQRENQEQLLLKRLEKNCDNIPQKEPHGDIRPLWGNGTCYGLQFFGLRSFHASGRGVFWYEVNWTDINMKWTDLSLSWFGWCVSGTDQMPTRQIDINQHKPTI